MTNPLSMSMFASKEDLQASRISQLEADKAALMEVVRATWQWSQCYTHASWSGVTTAFSSLPAHLKEAAKEEAR